MSRFSSLLLLGGLLGTPLAAGAAQDRPRPTPRREAPDRPRAEPRQEQPKRQEPRVEPRREAPRARPPIQERAEPRRDAPAERRDAAPPKSTGEPELRRRKADKPD
ncbi:MAG TPA: hypothetical protein VFT04_09380 [Gemmatimonadales bacterium]|nr:hypothetical protein [Gemmatimonadales bacterium]